MKGTGVSVDWSKIFFFHQSTIQGLGSVLAAPSIDNSKIFFGRALSECKSERLFKSVCLSVG